MWKVALENIDSPDSLPVWWDWALLRSRGSVGFPAGHMPSQTAHLFTPTPALPTGFLPSPQSRLLVAPQKRTDLITETKGLLQGQGWLLPEREIHPPPLSRRQFLSARAHFLHFHFLYLWIVNDTVPLWKWVWVPWSHNTSEVSVTERLDKGSYSLSNLKSGVGMSIYNSVKAKRMNKIKKARWRTDDVKTTL